MNISIPHDVFLGAIEKGGVSIFGSSGADEGLRETIPTQRCVKLTAKDGALFVESSVNKASSVYVCKTESLKIIEEGELCVDALELKSKLSSLKYPHLIYFEFDKKTANPKAGKPGDTIVPLGKVLCRAVNDAGREGLKLGLTVFSANDFVQTSYPDGIKPVLNIQSKAFSNAVNSISFASGEDQFTEIFNHICIITIDNATHLAATDNKRAALTTFDSSSCSGSTENKPILIETKLAVEMMKKMPCDQSFIDVILDEDGEHVVFKSQDMQVRTSMPPVAAREKFPKFANAINMVTGASVIFEPKKEIEQTISSLRSSSDMVMLKVDEGSETVEIKGWNSDLSGVVGCKKITTGLKTPIHLYLEFVADVIGKIKSDSIKFSFSSDERRVIVQSVDSPTPFYLMQRITPTEI